MFEVLRRWLSPVPPSRPPPPKPPDAPIDKLLDGLTVLGRTVGRLLVRVESLEGQVKTELAAVRGDLAKLEPQPQLSDLFSLADTLNDLLQQVDEGGLSLLARGELAAMSVTELAALAESDAPNPRARDLKRALSSSLGRLDRFLAGLGIAHVGRTGEEADARVLRVVDVVEREDLADGVIVSVVRPGFVRGSRVLREGDVVVNRRKQAVGAASDNGSQRANSEEEHDERERLGG